MHRCLYGAGNGCESPERRRLYPSITPKIMAQSPKLRRLRPHTLHDHLFVRIVVLSELALFTIRVTQIQKLQSKESD